MGTHRHDNTLEWSTSYNGREATKEKDVKEGEPEDGRRQRKDCGVVILSGRRRCYGGGHPFGTRGMGVSDTGEPPLRTYGLTKLESIILSLS